MMLEFKVNNYITLKLEKGKTNIYVNRELFIQCKYILTRKKIHGLKDYLKEIKSIDELAKHLNHSLEGVEPELIDIPAETRFWVHCSNMQAWIENDYDTRLLHSNLAFPLLKKLADLKYDRVKIRLREEIVKRLESGFLPTIKFIVNEGYLDYLENNDYLKKSILEKLIEKITDFSKDPIYRDTFSYDYDNLVFPLLKELAELGDIRAKVRLREEIIKTLESGFIPTVIFLANKGYLNCLKGGEYLKDRNLRDLIEEITDMSKDPIYRQTVERDGISFDYNYMYMEPLYRNSISYSLKISDLLKLMIKKEEAEILRSLESKIRMNIRVNERGTGIEVLNRRISKLNLSDLNLGGEIPEEIRNFASLTYLNLSHCRLKKIPDWLSELINLRRLELWKNKIASIPDSFGNLTHLQTLSLDKNLFENFPKIICELSNLESLTITRGIMNIGIKTIPPEIGNLTKLKSLRLDHNLLESLPESIGKLHNLESLDLMRNNLKVLPESIKYMKNLRSLNIAYNNLTEIPYSIAELPNLKIISLGKNPLKTLPISLCENEKLEKIHIEKSQYDNLAPQIRNALKDKLDEYDPNRYR